MWKRSRSLEVTIVAPGVQSISASFFLYARLPYVVVESFELCALLSVAFCAPTLELRHAAGICQGTRLSEGGQLLPADPLLC